MRSRAKRSDVRAVVAVTVAVAGVLGGACGRETVPLEALAQVDAFALRDVSVIPMDREEVLREQTLVVRDGRVTALGSAGEVDVPADLPIVDGAGLYVMPGLWDLHVHLEREEALPLYQVNGITTIVNLGGDEGINLERRQRIAAGGLAGPRLLTCGPVVHGHSVDAETVGARIAAIAAAGYDCVKVYSEWDEEAYRAASDAAEAHDVLFLGHAPRNLPFDVVLDDGREQIVHLEELVYTTELDDWLDRWRDGAEPGPDDDPRIALDSEVRELARRTAERGIPVVATEIVIDNYLERASEEGRERLAARPYMRYVDPVARRSWRDDDQSGHRTRFEQQVALQHFMLEVFREEGVPMALGTDAMLDSGLQVVPGWSLHEELGIMIEAGYTPFEALRLATVDAAAFMGRAGEGIVRQGARADLIVLGSNPLEDVARAADVLAVVTGGRWTGRGELERRLADLESTFEALEAEVAVLDEAFDEGLDALAATWETLEAPSPRIAGYVEQRLNRLGYIELGEERIEEAIRIFAANVEMFPRSANTYDSLAEAHLTGGNRRAAIDWYRRALEVDPAFGNARRMLEEIGAEP